jgi:uncharacterized membrane protein (DUF373 family)
MRLQQRMRAEGERWRLFSVYEGFEHLVILLLTALIAVIVVAAVWSLGVRVLFGLVLSGALDPTEHAVFQDVFGRIFTVIIALEFKRSLLVVTERKSSVVHVRAVVLIAMLAIVRKFILLDVTRADALVLVGLAAAVLALGAVHWLVREQDRRERA